MKLKTPCILCDGALYKGYGRVMHKGKRQFAHRVAYVEANGLRIGDILDVSVLQRCFNRACINPEHLYTAVKRRHDHKGSKNPRAKLTEVQVAELRLRLSKGERQVDLRKEYRIDDATISHIKEGHTWKGIV